MLLFTCALLGTFVPAALAAELDGLRYEQRGLQAAPAAVPGGVPQSWSMFGRTALHDSRSPFAGPPAGKVEALWSVQTGAAVTASAVFSEGSVIIGSTSGLLFQIALGGPSVGIANITFSDPIASTAATLVGGGFLYSTNALFLPGAPFASTHDLGGKQLPNGNYVGASFTVSADATFAMKPTGEKLGSFKQVKAINLSDTSENLWLYKAPADVLSTPAIDETSVYFGCDNAVVYALRISDGSVKWEAPMPESVTSSPAVGVDEGLLYVSCSNMLYALNITDGSVAWSVRTGLNSTTGYFLCVGAPPAAVFWGAATLLRTPSPPPSPPRHPSPALSSKHVIVGSTEGRVYAFDRATGASAWRFTPVRARKLRGVRGFYATAAVGADNSAYIGSADGTMYALSSRGKLLWRFATGGPILSSAAISPAGHLVFGSSDGNVYALAAVPTPGTPHREEEGEHSFGRKLAPSGAAGTTYYAALGAAAAAAAVVGAARAARK